VELRKERCEIVALMLWRTGWCCRGKEDWTSGVGPWCCGELGVAVEVREEGREVLAPAAVKSLVLLWR
jgi:hypothetical protein